jgi:L-iditol 2-dehydrogenase
MLQAVMTAPRNITFKDVPVPAIHEGQALVRIMNIGICGSDVHVYHGKHPYTSYPVIQGHEVSGEIVMIAPDEKQFQVGDRITIQPQVVCGRCFSCTHGNYHICDSLKVMGFQTTGVASEYFAVDSCKLIKLPKGFTYETGSMIEPVAVAVHALSRSSNIKGKRVVVLGAGPIGNLVAQVAKGLGAESVLITDISNYRLEIARFCGIDYCTNTMEDNLGIAILNSFGTDGADLFFECVGVSKTIDQAINYARKGSDIIIVGVFGDYVNINMAAIQDRELRLIGTLMYQRNDFLKAIELIENKKINLDPILTCYFDFKEYKKAYEYIDEQKDRIMKVMIQVHKE